MKFSILIPTHNRPEMFERTLNSAIKQNYENLEIIVSDDSNENYNYAEEIVNKLKDSRIKFYRNYPSGPKANYEFLLSKSSGEYSNFLEDDDYYIYPNLFTKCYNIIKRHSDVNGVVFNFWENRNNKIDIKAHPKYLGLSEIPKYKEVDKGINYLLNIRKIYYNFPLFIFKTNLLKNMEFNEGMVFNDFQSFFTVCLEKGNICHLNSFEIVISVHGSNMSWGQFENCFFGGKNYLDYAYKKTIENGYDKEIMSSWLEKMKIHHSFDLLRTSLLFFIKNKKYLKDKKRQVFDFICSKEWGLENENEKYIGIYYRGGLAENFKFLSKVLKLMETEKYKNKKLVINWNSEDYDFLKIDKVKNYGKSLFDKYFYLENIDYTCSVPEKIEYIKYGKYADVSLWENLNNLYLLPKCLRVKKGKITNIVDSFCEKNKISDKIGIHLRYDPKTKGIFKEDEYINKVINVKDLLKEKECYLSSDHVYYENILKEKIQGIKFIRYPRKIGFLHDGVDELFKQKNNVDRMLLAEEALIECLILSRCKKLIINPRSGFSNLSRVFKIIYEKNGGW